jgi:hypothetical protein
MSENARWRCAIFTELNVDVAHRSYWVLLANSLISRVAK